MGPRLAVTTSGSATFITHGGRLWVSGIDNFGELGIVPPHRVTRFTEIELPHTAWSVVATPTQTMVISADGTLSSSGHGTALGVAPQDMGFHRAETPGPVRSAAANPCSVLVCLHDGSLWMAGPSAWPAMWRPFASHSPVERVLTAGSDYLAVRTDGTLLSIRQPRLPAFDQSPSLPVPEVLQLPAPVSDISTSNHHILAVLVDGSLWSMGTDRRGETGQRPGTASSGFIRVPLHEAVVRVAVGASHSAVLSEHGTVLTAGAGERGQLGAPRAPYAGSGFGEVEGLCANDLAAGGDVTVAVSAADVFVTGDNRSSQLGLETRGESCILGPRALFSSLPTSLLTSLARSAHADEEVVVGLAPSWSGTLTELLEAAAALAAARP